MKRSVLVVVLTIAAALSMSLALSGDEGRRDNSTKVKQVKVNAGVLAKLPADRKYIVDLTRKGTIYQFDPTAGSVDLKRVAIRTTKGVEAIESVLGKALSKKELAQWYSQGFRIGSVTAFKSSFGTPSAAMGFNCDSNYCTCRGLEDCTDLAHTDACGGGFFACTTRGDGVIRCICSRGAIVRP